MNKEVNEDPKPRIPALKIRQMEIDDIASVFHLGELLFKAEESSNPNINPPPCSMRHKPEN